MSALAHSSVPVLIRHVDEAADAPDAQDVDLPRRILVPLDGSRLAEKALPLAQELATEWHASMWLAQAVPDTQTPSRESMIAPAPGLYQPADLSQLYPDAKSAAQEYLAQVAHGISGEVHAEVSSGPPVYTLTRLVDEWSITAVVLASHGRTAVAQFFLGSVAYELVHHLRCPVIVVPVVTAKSV